MNAHALHECHARHAVHVRTMHSKLHVCEIITAAVMKNRPVVDLVTTVELIYRHK